MPAPQAPPRPQRVVTTMQLLSLVHARWVMRNVATLARRASHRATSAGRARGSTGSVTAARAGGSGGGELASGLLTAAVVVAATVLLTSAGAASVAGAVGGCGEHARCTLANGATAQPARRAREIQTHGVMRSILTQETSAKLCSFSASSLAATASVVPCQFAPPCRHPNLHGHAARGTGRATLRDDASYQARGRSMKFGLLTPACGIFLQGHFATRPDAPTPGRRPAGVVTFSVAVVVAHAASARARAAADLRRRAFASAGLVAGRATGREARGARRGRSSSAKPSREGDVEHEALRAVRMRCRRRREREDSCAERGQNTDFQAIAMAEPVRTQRSGPVPAPARSRRCA